MIECRTISKTFGAFKVLDKVSFSIPSEKCYGFLGQNGAGKTTVLRMLVGLLRPDQGEIFVAGHSLLTERQQIQRLCGYLPQRPEFYPWLSGEEFLRLSAELVGVPVRQAKNAAGKYLDTVGLAEFARRRVGKYSGGMQQRLGLAAALIGDPPVLLLDEPVSALDPQGRDAMFFLVAALSSLVGLGIGAYYTAELIGPVHWSALSQGALLYVLYQAFLISVILLASALVTSPTLAGGIALITIVFVNLLLPMVWQGHFVPGLLELIQATMSQTAWSRSTPVWEPIITTLIGTLLLIGLQIPLLAWRKTSH